MVQHRHILVMSSWFPNRLDPYAGNFVQRFAELLSDDFEVSVIHTLGDKSVSQLEVIDTVENNVRIVRAYHPVSKNKVLHWWNQRKALRACLRKIEDVDLIFAHVLLPRGFQFTKAKRYYHRNLVVLEHASYYRNEVSSRFKGFTKTFLKQVSRHIEQLCAVSPVLVNDMKRIFPTTKITVVPNFVDSDLFTPGNRSEGTQKRFLHISTLDKMTKNPDILFEGFKQAYQQDKNMTLTVVSDQSTENWKKWAEEQKLSLAIQWIGPSSWEEIAAIMKEHDCLLLTSEYETFNIVLAEAWCSGLPVISPSVGIAFEMNETLGIQLQNVTISDVSESILQFRDKQQQFNPAVIREFGLQFSKERVLNQLKEIFEPHFKEYE